MNDIVELEDGFYLKTEDDWVGPFLSFQMAKTALDAYLRWGQADHQDSIKKMKDTYD